MLKLFDIQRIILEEFEQQPFYERQVFQQITLDNAITGILGLRGIGKTTYLLHQALQAGAKKQKALYVSADNFYFLEHRLLELVDYLYKETEVRLLCVDEIHKYPTWNQELKNIYDTYRGFKLLFSGSSAIDLVHSKYDLSRRVILHELNGLSFREYLEINLNLRMPSFSLSDLTAHHAAIAAQLSVPKILSHFREYLRIGYYPFFREFSQDRDKFQAMENATQKAIYEDIGTLHSLKTTTLRLIEQLFRFILNSAPGELSAYKLSRTLEKDFESITNYLEYLNQAGLIRFLYPKKTGRAGLRNPGKIYPNNTNLMHAAYLPTMDDSMVGKARETFMISQLQNAKLQVYASEAGDFRVDEMSFEVGGKNKTGRQLNQETQGFVVADGIVTGLGNKIPLYLFGFLS